MSGFIGIAFNARFARLRARLPKSLQHMSLTEKPSAHLARKHLQKCALGFFTIKPSAHFFPGLRARCALGFWRNCPGRLCLWNLARKRAKRAKTNPSPKPSGTPEKAPCTQCTRRVPGAIKALIKALR